ncbi:MAG TPA: hypothetical protein VFU54_09045 [Actinomycetota bacterium]|nr:hypothetical protein [Actinomycetota bacterium]
MRFAAYTGLRAGELVALRVRHLNLLRGRCEVGESATEVDGRLVWGADQDLRPPHGAFCLASCATSSPHTWLRGRMARMIWFTAPQGGPLREQKFVTGIFKPALARAGLPHRLRF